MKRRVLITATGALTPIGNDTETTWENIKKGVCGIAPITRYDSSKQKIKLAGEIKNLDPSQFINKKDMRKMDHFTQFALIASKEAFKKSGLDMTQENPYRCGVIISSGIGGLNIIEQEHNKGLEKGFDRISPFFIPMVISNIASGTVAIEHSFQGNCSSIVTACAGGTNAVGEAFKAIRDGYAEIMLCGGTESSITPLGVGGFTSMKALSESQDPMRASIPFDKERSGFVMGEGAGVLILEEYEHAIKRKASIIAEIVGYSSTCDAYHMTAPSPDANGASQCIRQTIADANLFEEDIDYINAHGTSTPMNDKCETLAIKEVFKEEAFKIPISSTKSMTGHLLGASGAIEAIITALALKDGYIPATINYKYPDPECDLDIVPNIGRKANLKYALSNSLGFGGHNASIILKKF